MEPPPPRRRRAGPRFRAASGVDGFPVARGAGYYPDETTGPAVPGGRQGCAGGTEDRRSGKSSNVPKGPSWLPGDLRQADLVTEVDGALAAHHLWWARPGAPCVKQARYAAPHVPVRELGGIRPPVRDLLFKALLPGQGVALHRSPLEDLGIG